MAIMWRLPEECISKILSQTSPGDACRMMGVSKEFQNAAESNLVWNKFLPLHSHRIISSSSSSTSIPPFSNSKELFFLLSASILVDGGNKSFALERSTGRKTYILSSRDLSILNNDGDSNWTSKSIQESRFREVGELQRAERVEIEGKIRTETLSPNTEYGAYLIFKLAQNAYGLHSIPFETFIACGDRLLSTNTATLRHPAEANKPALQALFYGNRMQKMTERLNGGDASASAAKRDDGWLEIEIGDFFVGGGTSGSGDDEIIRMGVMEIKGFQLKGGLIVEGIHVRPKA